MADRHAPALVGRDADLEVLRAFAAGAARDGGALVVSGDPGQGKSTLLDAAARHAAGAGTRVVRSAGTAFEVDLPFSALDMLLRPLQDLLGDLAPDHAGPL